MSGKSSVLDGVFVATSFSRRAFGRVMWLVLGVSFISSYTAEASTPGTQDQTSSTFLQDLPKDQMLVRELMRLDAELALSRLQKGLSNASQESLQASSIERHQGGSHSNPKLVAIYGVGKQLLVEVSWLGQSYVFLKGKAEPVGRNSAVALRLKSLSPRCATFQEKEQRFELCLNSTDHGD